MYIMLRQCHRHCVGNAYWMEDGGIPVDIICKQLASSQRTLVTLSVRIQRCLQTEYKDTHDQHRLLLTTAPDETL